MKITLNLAESTTDITRLILSNIKDYLTPRFIKISQNIKSKLPQLIMEGLKQEPEYQSLLSGELRAEFGIASVSDVETVILAISNAVEFESVPIITTASSIKGGFILKIIKSDDIGGVITLGAANIVENGRTLPWLEWLSLRGNEILIKDYVVRLGPSPNSRSGLAIMMPSVGGHWRVPPKFIGTQQSNWTTRALDRIEDKISSLLQKTIEDEI